MTQIYHGMFFRFFVFFKTFQFKLLKSSRELKETFALIEIGGSHDECLYSQLYALKAAKKDVVLICTSEMKQRNPYFQDLVSAFIVVETNELKQHRNSVLRYILKNLKNKNVTTLILNTAQGTNVRKLCWWSLFSSIKFIGIIHTTRKFQGSFTQRIINLKIKNYLVLSQYLLSTIAVPKGIQMNYFYPIRFPDFDNSSTQKKGLRIAIIGGVENRRKDLNGFLNLLDKLKEKDIEFVFLGKSDFKRQEVINFKLQLIQKGFQDHVQLFDSFVSQHDFDTQLKQTDFIMPLVHPDTPSAEQYFKNQISGAMTISFGYKIPLLIHEAYQFIDEMKSASFYYNFDNFDTIVAEAIRDKNHKMADMKNNPEYSAEIQEQRYLDFILR